MNRHHDEPVSLFKAACEQFRASLSEKQRQIFKEYPDAISMLDAIRGQAEQHPTHKALLARCCKKIFALSTMMEPYFEVINLFVSSHPEFAGIAWGALRLVFVVRPIHPLHPRFAFGPSWAESVLVGNKPCAVPRPGLRVIRDDEHAVAGI
jgi:hypothetical protein